MGSGSMNTINMNVERHHDYEETIRKGKPCLRLKCRSSLVFCVSLILSVSISRVKIATAQQYDLPMGGMRKSLPLLSNENIPSPVHWRVFKELVRLTQKFRDNRRFTDEKAAFALAVIDQKATDLARSIDWEKWRKEQETSHILAETWLRKHLMETARQLIKEYNDYPDVKAILTPIYLGQPINDGNIEFLKLQAKVFIRLQESVFPADVVQMLKAQNSDVEVIKAFELSSMKAAREKYGTQMPNPHPLMITTFIDNDGADMTPRLWDELTERLSIPDEPDTRAYSQYAVQLKYAYINILQRLERNPVFEKNFHLFQQRDYLIVETLVSKGRIPPYFGVLSNYATVTEDDLKNLQSMCLELDYNQVVKHYDDEEPITVTGCKVTANQAERAIKKTIAIGTWLFKMTSSREHFWHSRQRPIRRLFAQYPFIDVFERIADHGAKTDSTEKDYYSVIYLYAIEHNDQLPEDFLDTIEAGFFLLGTVLPDMPLNVADYVATVSSFRNGRFSAAPWAQQRYSLMQNVNIMYVSSGLRVDPFVFMVFVPASLRDFALKLFALLECIENVGRQSH